MIIYINDYLSFIICDVCDVLNKGIAQLLYTRTSRKFLACRLHPEMENKILFLTSKVQ